jgi:type IV pilus assembly protein PilV
MTATTPFRKRSAGFTMLEVLVTIVIVSFGLLGIAGLQIFALKNSQSAGFRSAASQQASNLIERIRANPVGATAYGYNLPNTSFYTTAVANCGAAAGCSAADLAKNDAYQWKQQLAAALPSGAGIVCIDSTPNDGTSASSSACDNIGSLYAVKIWWLDDRSRANQSGTLERFSTAFRP